MNYIHPYVPNLLRRKARVKLINKIKYNLSAWLNQKRDEKVGNNSNPISDNSI